MPSKKALEKALKKEKEIAELEKQKQEDASWEIGINKKGKLREEMKNEKHEQKLKRNKEMKDLLEHENETLSNIGKRPKTRRTKNDDFSLLNEALKNAPKTRSQKEAELKQKQREQEKFIQLKREKEKEERLERERKENYLLEKKGIVKDSSLMLEINNNDIYEEKSVYMTGIDSALDFFDENHHTKLSFDDFFKEKLPIIKEQIPGLRLSQYKDKILKLWKNSIENPINTFN
tara:strand:- start:70 stop:768 length:699 start_codon:yes stop_codon:yes gene_type:complete